MQDIYLLTYTYSMHWFEPTVVLRFDTTVDIIFQLFFPTVQYFIWETVSLILANSCNTHWSSYWAYCTCSSVCTPVSNTAHDALLHLTCSHTSQNPQVPLQNVNYCTSDDHTLRWKVYLPTQNISSNSIRWTLSMYCTISTQPPLPFFPPPCWLQ